MGMMENADGIDSVGVFAPTQWRKRRSMRDEKKTDLRIKKTNASEIVCTKIKERVQEGIWKTGSRLPSESDLADMFGVNRLTVRMAIQKLNALGVLETRTGSGTYVVEFNFEDFIAGISEFYMQPELLNDVEEFRRLLELECASLAIERGTEEELEELRRLVEVYGGQVRECYAVNTLEAYKLLAKLDIDVHQHICKMSHNALYLYSFSVARESIYQYLMIINKQRLDHWKNQDVTVDAIKNAHVEIHMDLYEAIRDKNKKKCLTIYRKMIDHHVNLEHRAPWRKMPSV